MTSRLIINKDFPLYTIYGYFHDSNNKRIPFRPFKFLYETLRNSNEILNVLLSLSCSSLKAYYLYFRHKFTNSLLVRRIIKTLLLVINAKAYKLLVTTSYLRRVRPYG